MFRAHVFKTGLTKGLVKVLIVISNKIRIISPFSIMFSKHVSLMDHMMVDLDLVKIFETEIGSRSR